MPTSGLVDPKAVTKPQFAMTATKWQKPWQSPPMRRSCDAIRLRKRPRTAVRPAERQACGRTGTALLAPSSAFLPMRSRDIVASYSGVAEPSAVPARRRAQPIKAGYGEGARPRHQQGGIEWSESYPPGIVAAHVKSLSPRGAGHDSRKNLAHEC